MWTKKSNNKLSKCYVDSSAIDWPFAPLILGTSCVNCCCIVPHMISIAPCFTGRSCMICLLSCLWCGKCAVARVKCWQLVNSFSNQPKMHRNKGLRFTVRLNNLSTSRFVSTSSLLHSYRDPLGLRLHSSSPPTSRRVCWDWGCDHQESWCGRRGLGCGHPSYRCGSARKHQKLRHHGGKYTNIDSQELSVDRHLVSIHDEGDVAHVLLQLAVGVVLQLRIK